MIPLSVSIFTKLNSKLFHSTDDFKFDKGSLFLSGFISKIKSFQVYIKESDKTIERMYKPIDDDKPYFIDDFKIDFENIYYKD